MGKSFSWEVVDRHTAYKVVDKSIYKYYETGVPIDLVKFFSNDLKSGEKRIIKIKFKNKIYDAFLIADHLKSFRTKLVWNKDLGREINREIENCLEKGRKQNIIDSNIFMKFRKLDSNYYLVNINKIQKDLTKTKKNETSLVKRQEQEIKERTSDYIEVPKYYDDNKVECESLNNFMKTGNYLDDDKTKIDMESLRNFYINNKGDFFKLIEELKMRGFNFITNRDNKRFFYISNELKETNTSKFIFVEKDKERYKLINKNIFNNFRYDDINSDFYFNLLPIKRLRVIYPEYSEVLIESEFENYGFKIYSYSEINNKNYDYDVVNNKYEQILKELSINEILEDNYLSHVRIKKYLKHNNICNLLDFKNMDTRKLLTLDGVGEKTVLDLRKEFEKVENNIKESEGIYGVSKVEDDIFMGILERIKISDLLPNNYQAYKNIEKKLNEDNIYNLKDLLNYDMNKLRKLKGVGSKRFGEFEKIIKEEIKKARNKRENFENSKFYLSSKNTNLKDMSIGDLLIRLNMDSNYSMVEYMDLKLETFIGMTFQDIGDKYSLDISIVLNSLYNKIKKLQNINIIVSKTIKEIEKKNTRNLDILWYRNIDSMTLEETGRKLNLTRERIRQIESNAIKELNKILRENYFYQSLNLLYLKDNKYIDYDEIERDIENNLFLTLIRNNKIKDIYYLEELNRIYFKNKSDSIKKIKKKLRGLNNFGYRSELNEVIKLMSVEFGHLNESNLNKIFRNLGYYIDDNYYYRENINKMEQLEILFYLVYENGYRIDEHTYKEINQKIYKIFGGKLGKFSGFRSLGGIADRSDNLILIGPRTYIHEAYAPISKEVLDSIYFILERELNKYNLITAEKLYGLFKEENEDRSFLNAVLSSHHIYSIVQKYFSDKFDFGHGNTMRILKKGQESRSNKQIIYDICKEHGGVIEIKDIVKILNWEEYKIDSAISNSDELLLINNKCIIASFFFNDYFVEKIRFAVEKNLEKGYTSSAIIMEDILFDRKILEVLNKLNIRDSKDITSLIKYICPDIEGHTLFLYTSDSKIKSIEDLVENKYREEFYREDVEVLLMEYGYSQGSINIKLNDLKKRGYVQIEETRYVNKNYINLKDLVDKNKMYKFINLVEESIDIDGFFIPNMHVRKARSILGNIGYSWNQYLIAAILEDEGFIRLDRYNISYLNEIIVMVDKDSTYRSIHELVYYLLKYEYRGKMQEKDVYEYLAQLGIYEKVKADTEKRVQGDIKYKGLIDINLVGQVSLK